MAASGEIASGEAIDIASLGVAETVVPRPPALRDFALAGRFFGANAAAPALRLAEFLFAKPGDAILTWFGADKAATFLARPERLRYALDRDIAAIDALISAQLDAILHHQRLRRLEGSWRGLDWLTGGIPGNARVKVRLLSVSWAEIARDLERAPEFDQSQLFRKIYEEEFGIAGGEPYGLLLIDHEVRHRPGPGSPTDDVTVLNLLAGVAAAAFVPTVLGASPALLQVDDFIELAGVADIVGPFRSPEYQRWRSLASREDVRFLAVLLPRILARPPWREEPSRADHFRYNEYTPRASDRVWMSAVYAFAACATRAFVNFAWPADIRGCDTDREGGGLVTELPLEPFRTDPDHVWVRQSLDVVLTDAQERALVEIGLMPLSDVIFSDEAVFGAVRSLQAPTQFTGVNAAAARANARISAQVNSMLCVSRFAHYLKVIGRDMVGSFKTEDEIERELQTWLTGYVNSNTQGGSEARARSPLVSGRVTVKEKSGKPGVFSCTILLQPHYQLDDVSAQFRLVTEIAQPGARS